MNGAVILWYFPLITFPIASAKAFDQYGEMVGRYEKQLELKEKAESLATEVTK